MPVGHDIAVFYTVRPALRRHGHEESGAPELPPRMSIMFAVVQVADTIKGLRRKTRHAQRLPPRKCGSSGRVATNRAPRKLQVAEADVSCRIPDGRAGNIHRTLRLSRLLRPPVCQVYNRQI